MRHQVIFWTLFVLLLLAAAYLAHAHPPKGGIYPTTKAEWSACCGYDIKSTTTGDCRPADVQVVPQDGEKSAVFTNEGNFFLSPKEIHQIRNMGAHEAICTMNRKAPLPDGSNVLCVFWSAGMF